MLVLALSLLLLGLGWTLKSRFQPGVTAGPLLPPAAPVAEDEAIPVAVAAAGTGDEPPAEVVVHVAGAVQAPGVYRLNTGARIIDAIEIAGGPTGDAVLDVLNLAEPVFDAMRIYVPVAGDDACPDAGVMHPDRSLASNNLVDINRATAEQLQALPGIGPVLAGRIVAYREQNGPFRSPEDLLAVSGIGPKVLEQLKPYLLIR